MDLTGIVHPEQLKMLTEALDRYCQATRIAVGSDQHAVAAKRIVALFHDGVDRPEDLVAALNRPDLRASSLPHSHGG
jgi:hypothetical protein